MPRAAAGVSRWRRLGLPAATAGAFGALCWLPTGLAPLLPLAAFAAMRGLRRAETGKDALFYGAVYGAARYAVAAHFLLALLVYSPLAIVLYLLVILSIVPLALLESWGAFALERRLGISRSYLFAALFAGTEWLRTRGDLSFPADLVAHAYGGHPSWLAVAAWTGPIGFTLLVFGTGALLEEAWESRRVPARAGAWAALAAALWVAPPLLDAAVRPEPAGAGAPVLRVGIVQPAIPLKVKVSREGWPAARARLATLTHQAARGADLVVWPETARPGPVVWDAERPFADPDMQALAAEVGVPILYGCEIARREGGVLRSLYNGAALVHPDGREATWYGKQHLLPFVEAIPFARLFGYEPLRDRPRGGPRSMLSLAGNFSPGPEPPLFEVGPARMGVLICFEGLYGSLGARYRRDGANALVVLTNDAWWGRSAFPAWHASAVAARAREIGVPVIRAANDGVSSLLDRTGRLREATGRGETATLAVAVTPGPPGPTTYALHGDLLALPVLLLLGLPFAADAWGRSRRRQPEALPQEG